MTVKELIDELSKLDPELEVGVRNNYTTFESMNSIYTDRTVDALREVNGARRWVDVPAVLFDE